MEELSCALSTSDEPPDDKVRRYLVKLEYLTLILTPLVVYSKVLFPPNFIIKGDQPYNLPCHKVLHPHPSAGSMSMFPVLWDKLFTPFSGDN